MTRMIHAVVLMTTCSPAARVCRLVPDRATTATGWFPPPG